MATNSPSLKALAEQMAALTEQVQRLSARVERVERATRPPLPSSSWRGAASWFTRLWAGTLLAGADLVRRRTAGARSAAQSEATDPAVAVPDPDNLRAVLSYHLATLHRIPVIYYAVFAAIYLSAGISVGQALDGFAQFALWVRLVFGLLTILVGLGNLACIVWPSAAAQLRMVGPTVATAFIQLALGATAAIQANEVGVLISRVILWLIIAWAHIAWGRSIRGRISQRAFTLQLLTAATRREDGEHQVPSPPLPPSPSLLPSLTPEPETGAITQTESVGDVP